jgi:hypothetical protein
VRGLKMFRQREEVRKRLHEIVEVFRRKGATRPDKAMTPQELGLPLRFEEAMHRRLGRLGIFVEVNGKYYLSEERLKQLEEQQRNRGGNWGGGGAGGSRGSMFTLRIARMAMAALFILLVLVNLFVFSWELRIIAALVAVTWIALTIVQIVYMSRTRRRFVQTQNQLTTNKSLSNRMLSLVSPFFLQLHRHVAVLQD